MNPDDILAVFEHWRIIMGHSRARLDIKRAQVIRERLRDGYSVDDLMLAIEGNAASAWHQGENDRRTVFDSLGLILRDADNTEKFMAMGETARKMIANMQKRQEIEAAKEAKGPPTEEEKAKVRELLKSVRLRRVA
jgi:hypothetical protein